MLEALVQRPNTVHARQTAFQVGYLRPSAYCRRRYLETRSPLICPPLPFHHPQKDTRHVFQKVPRARLYMGKSSSPERRRCGELVKLTLLNPRAPSLSLNSHSERLGGWSNSLVHDSLHCRNCRSPPRYLQDGYRSSPFLALRSLF
jgi:hypothetical protein